MGIRAIEYRPWKGDRTDPNRRWLIISKHVFQKNLRAKGVLALLIGEDQQNVLRLPAHSRILGG